jgi:hypothetical protein
MNSEKLWSVVVPTIWRSGYTQELLHILNDEPLVGEIILIDNAPQVVSHDLSRLEKLVHLPQRSNIYVNPAWNLGVIVAKHAQVCLCNDDILFNTSVFANATKHLQLEQKPTIIGAHKESFTLGTDSHLSFSKGHWIGQGWGCLMFFKKQCWREIPNQLKIFCGDKFIATTFVNTHSVKLNIQTVMSSSSNSAEFSKLKMQDRQNFQSLTNYFSRAKWLCKHATSFGRFNLGILMITTIKEVIRS